MGIQQERRNTGVFQQCAQKTQPHQVVGGCDDLQGATLTAIEWTSIGAMEIRTAGIMPACPSFAQGASGSA